ncbi:MAG: hypothetical protein JWR08_637 [Enterovirga sp.]|nr:hypothetical protein [Enterovirga sp.]
MLRRFANDRKGALSIIFALALIPLVGVTGAAVDYSRAAEFRAFLHREADNAALAIASSDAPNAASTIESLRSRALTHYGPAGGRNPVQSVDVTSSWSGGSLFTLTATSAFASTVLKAVPGMPGAITVAVTTQVSRIAARWQWKLPEVRDLSFEAADYNRISVYCYNETKKDQPNKGRRLETLTAIADNGGTSYSGAVMPACEDGETLSYQLRNVRDSRTKPQNWTAASAEHYLYYTDTRVDPNTRVLTNTITGGREWADGTMTMTDLNQAPLLETIVCDTQAACRSKADGGILPNNHETGRTPATASGPCTEGKYVYYGWEDRPPVSQGASDKDYDDIRLVVSCPALVKIADKEVRIVR